jgi:hypothetical protein
MRALIVFESMFGNNRAIALSVADGLGPRWTTEVLEVGEAPTALSPELDLVVVGGPNHAFGLSRPATREQAKQETDVPLVSGGIGLREWLDVLHPVADPIAFGAFDTRADRKAVKLVDRSAGTIAKRLRRRGLRQLGDVASFFVQEMTGPLTDGELERARAWGAELATQVEPAVR